MIIKLKVENVRSIKSAVISFEKSGIEYRDQYVLRERYLNPITLYGDNGSGKSILLYTLKQLVLLMNYDEKTVEQESEMLPDIINFEKKESSFVPTITYTFKTISGLLFEYCLVGYSNVIVKEKLTLLMNNRRKTLLSRNNKHYKIHDIKEQYNVGVNYSSIRKVGIEEYNDINSPYYIIKECYKAMREVIYIDSDQNVFGYRFLSTSPKDVMLKNKNVSLYISKFSALPPFKYFEKKSDDGKGMLYVDFGKNSVLPVGALSTGVNKTSYFVGALEVASSSPDSVVVIDEISSSVHPINIKMLVDEFVAKKIQLFFSCHSTNLLKYFRPDQVYFAYLKENIESVYYCLNQLHPNIREINNVESMYLKGIFDEELQNKN